MKTSSRMWRILACAVALAVFLLPTVLSPVVEAGDTIQSYPLMHPDDDTLAAWVKAYDLATRTDSFSAPRAAALSGGSVDLLPHMVHIPSERSQGACGNCWAWAGTGCMEIALSVQEGIRDRLSVQVVNSCRSIIGKYCCQGGWLYEFADFYNTTERALPWSNLNAQWQDQDGACTVPCGAIATEPSYSVAHIESLTIPTLTGQGVSTRAQAIANIKSVLDSGKGVWFAYFAPPDGWTQFYSYWGSQTETSVISMDSMCAGTTNGGGHAVLCVGYNDIDPYNRYWIMLNSWGTAGGRRPNGLFRVNMDMDYNTVCAGRPAFYWQTLDIRFRELPLVTTGEAQHITARTATGTGTLEYDSGIPTDVRFEYGTSAGGPYPYSTPWQHGLATGEGFEATLSGLLPGTRHYYRAQAFNPGGSSNGGEESFHTSPLPPSGFLAQATGEDRVELTWQRGAGATSTVVRGQKGALPEGPNDGLLIYDGTGTSATHAGLEPGTAYFYRAWSVTNDAFAGTLLSQESSADCAHTIGNGVWMVGDVNLDGRVTIVDAMYVAQHTVGLRHLDATSLLCADTTGDGAVNILDAMHIAQFSVDPDGAAGILFKPLWESPQDDGMLDPLAPCAS